jgi:hypothetical protein
LPALAEMIGALFEELAQADEDEGSAELVAVTVDLPIEVDVAMHADSAGEVATVRVGPPTLYTETSVMPVFHRLMLRLEPQHGG